MITKCKLAMYKIFDKLSGDDKNTLRTICNYVTYDIKDEERLINQCVEYLTGTCSSYVIEYISNIDDIFDRLEKGPCRQEELNILLKYRNDLMNLFDTELGDCLKITTNYSNIELANLYKENYYMKRDTHYFKFTLDSYKKLSKDDILNILYTNMKNGTLESTMFRSTYIQFLYLFENGHSINEFTNSISKYTLIKDNTYIAKFYYDYNTFDNIYDSIINNKCDKEITDFLNSINKNEIDELHKICCFITSDTELFETLTHSLRYVCYSNGLYSIVDYTNGNIDDMFNEFLEYELIVEETSKKIILSYKDRFYKFYDNEFGNCFNITSKYTRADYIEYEQLYKMFN